MIESLVIVSHFVSVLQASSNLIGSMVVDLVDVSTCASGLSVTKDWLVQTWFAQVSLFSSSAHAIITVLNR